MQRAAPLSALEQIGNETTTLGTVGMIHLTWFGYTVHAFDNTTPAGSLVGYELHACP